MLIRIVLIIVRRELQICKAQPGRIKVTALIILFCRATKENMLRNILRWIGENCTYLHMLRL